MRWYLHLPDLSVNRTPLLRDHRDRNDIRDANDGKSEYFDPADPTAFRALPRERSADDAEGIHHPLTLPRVKQRPRRARSSTTSIRSADTAKQGGSATPQGLSSTGDLSALVSDEGGVNVNGTDLDIFGGVFGRASGVQNSSARGDGASVVVNDPLFSSSASSLALDPLGVGPTGGVGASGEKMAAVAVSKKVMLTYRRTSEGGFTSFARRRCFSSLNAAISFRAPLAVFINNRLGVALCLSVDALRRMQDSVSKRDPQMYRCAVALV